MDTVSIVVTQYNNTAITETKTIHGDVRSLNTSMVSEALSIASSINAYEGNPEYNGGSPPFQLVSGTDGNVGNGVSIPYPTPYVAVFALDYNTLTTTASQCPSGLSPGNGVYLRPSCYCMMNDTSNNQLLGASTSYIKMSRTYFEALDTSSGSFFSNSYASVNMDKFRSWLYSDTSLIEAVPDLKTCLFPVGLNGPPMVKIPVTATTATTTNTIRGLGSYITNTLEPQSRVAQPGSSQTPTNPAPSLVSPADGPSQTRENSAYADTSLAPPVPSSPDTGPSPAPATVQQDEQSNAPQSPVAPQGSPTQPANEYEVPQTPASITPQSAGNQAEYSPLPTPTRDARNQVENPPGSEIAPASSQDSEDQPEFSPTAAVAAPPVSYAGATVKPDSYENYGFPGVGKVSPGGPPITANNVIYSLAPSAAAIISDGQSIPLMPAPRPTKGVLDIPPTITFGGSTFRADSSNYVIGSQTLKPGAPAIIASGVPLSLLLQTEELLSSAQVHRTSLLRLWRSPRLLR